MSPTWTPSASLRRRPAKAQKATYAVNPGLDFGRLAGSAALTSFATSGWVGMRIAASAFRFRGSTTPSVGSRAIVRSATAERKTPRTIVKRVSGRDPVAEPYPIAHSSSDLPIGTLVAPPVVSDGGVELGDLFASVGYDQITRGADVGQDSGSFDLGCGSLSDLCGEGRRTRCRGCHHCAPAGSTRRSRNQ